MIVSYKSQWQNSLENPYRFFFPFSIFGLFLGLSVVLFPINSQIIFWHKELLITLFLLPIITGFLYTATPRFFNSYFAKEYEIFLTILNIIVLFIFYFLNHILFFVIAKFFYILQIFIFVTLRFIRRKSGNPLFSSFIFISLVSGLLGTILQILFLGGNYLFLYKLYYVLYYYAMVWILLFGVGTKFFPMLTLTTPISENRKYQILKKELYNSQLFWWIFAIIFFLTFLIEATQYEKIALWFRAILVLFLSHEAWYLYFPAQRKGVYTFFIKLFLYTIVIAHFIFPFFLHAKQHLYHTIFVGGYLGLVLLVFGRVVISHEKLDLSLEVKSKLIAVAFSIIYIALWTRITAHLVNSYENHLKYASFTAIIGILFFLYVLIKNLYNKYKINNKS